MKISDLVTKIDGDIHSKLTERNAHAATLADLRGAVEPDEAKYEGVRNLKNGIDAEIDALQAKRADLVAEQARDDAMNSLASQPGVSAPAPVVPAARVGAEARTYTKASARDGVSFFQDMYQAKKNDNYEARQRLERHGAEVRVEREQSERSLGTSGLAGLVPPNYLTDEAALVARSGRPFANIVRSAELPPEGLSIIIPVGTTGASAAVQTSENSTISTTDEVWANVTAPVCTIAGYAPVSRQSLERGMAGLDAIIFQDLVGAYAVAVDQQALNGTGTSGQALGILKTAGINSASAFTASATVTTFYSKLAGQVNAVQTNRFMAPNAIVMHPRRWNWLLTQVDSSNRPLVVPNSAGPFNAFGSFEGQVDASSQAAVGTILGLPVYTDASIPVAVGTASEDQVLVLRTQDSIIWEDSAAPATMSFEQTAAASLTVTLVAYGYMAFTAGRYPSSVGVVGGISGAGFGLVSPSF